MERLGQVTEGQADQIIDFLYGMHRPPDQDATRRAWRIQLRDLDPDVASRACIDGAQVWGRFPSWPEFYGLYRSLVRKNKQATKVLCKTCQDDRFVVVAQRPYGVGFVDEMAPCPDCTQNVNTRFTRADGKVVETPPPSEIRRMMNS